MTNSFSSAQQISSDANPNLPINQLPYCTLQWRRGQLLVKSSQKIKQPYLPPLNDEQLLVNCLKYSLVNWIIIDPNLDKQCLNLWLEAAAKAGKPIFLRLHPSTKKTYQRQHLRKLIESLLAAGLLLLMSPVILTIFLILKLALSESVFTTNWHVGEKGKLFRAFKFRTNVKEDISHLNWWISKYDLNHLPQLLNVIRGEMSLISYRACSLENVVKLNLEKRDISYSWKKSNWLNLDSHTP